MFLILSSKQQYLLNDFSKKTDSFKTEICLERKHVLRIIFLVTNSRQQYFSNDISKKVTKLASLKVKICQEKVLTCFEFYGESG